MYLLLLFQSSRTTFSRGLYIALLALTVVLGLSVSFQESLNTTLLTHTNIICLFKLSMLVVLWMLNMRKLAYTFAVIGIVWTLLFSDMVPSDNSSMVVVLMLLVGSLLFELGKLIKLDTYYKDKAHLDLIGLILYLGLIFVLI